MPIRKPINTPNGLTSFHEVDQAVLQGTKFKLRVNGYPTKEALDNKSGILWQEYPIVPLSAMGEDGNPSFERYLVTQPGGLYEGGEYIEPAAPVEPEPVPEPEEPTPGTETTEGGE